MNYEEVVEQRKAHLEQKAEKFKTFSENAKARADEHFDKAHNAVSGIPFGQPILVGHHSQRRHERALERQDLHVEKAFAETDKREKYEAKAQHVDILLEKMESSPTYMSNKIREAERTIGTISRFVRDLKIYKKAIEKGDGVENHWYVQQVKTRFEIEDMPDCNRKIERYTVELEQAKEKCAYWKNKLDTIGGVIDLKTIHKGDYVETPWGNFEVIRVNRKTVTVTGWLRTPGLTYNLPPEKIKGVIKA